MSNFLEKLKKGMGIDGQEEIKETPEIKIPLSKKKTGRPKKTENKIKPPEPQIEKLTLEIPPEADKEEFAIAVPLTPKISSKEKWGNLEKPAGQLAIDVYQTANDLVIQSAIAGISPENLEISIERDVVAIRGTREKPFEEEGEYFNQECYWGPFSREVILPVEVDPDRAEAKMKEGILTIRLPKILREKKRKITVKI